MDGPRRPVWDVIADQGIDPARVARYQIAALGPGATVALTVWTREGIDRTGQAVLKRHEFVLDEKGTARVGEERSPRPHGAVERAVGRRRAFAVALRRRVA